jgi:hypothetical protein
MGAIWAALDPQSACPLPGLYLQPPLPLPLRQACSASTTALMLARSRRARYMESYERLQESYASAAMSSLKHIPYRACAADSSLQSPH